MLVVAELRAQDEGHYTCVASNQLGSTQARTHLVVNERPRFIRTPANVTHGVESKSLVLECNARGRPQPIVRWSKWSSSSSVAVPLVDSAEYLITAGGHLFIERLSVERHEAVFVCTASNEQGSSVEARTQVLVRPLLRTRPPLIAYQPQNQTVPINTQVLLECAVVVVDDDHGTETAYDDEDDDDDEERDSSSSSSSAAVAISWFKATRADSPGKQLATAGASLKYRLVDETGSLEINNVQK